MGRNKQNHENKFRRHLFPILICIAALIITTLAVLSILQVIPINTASVLSLIVGILSFLIPSVQNHYNQLAPASLEKPDISTSNTIKSSETPISSTWNVPYHRNSFFIGRNEILNQLRDKLTITNGLTQQQPQILSGLGGIGKTQIALEFAYRYQHKYPFILWLRAETRSSLITDIVAIPNLFSSQEAEEWTDDIQERRVILSFRAWLASKDGWLLILDNVDDLQVVHELLPTKGKGHVLLTTRIQAVGNVGNKIEVEKMDQEDGILFLLRRARKVGLDDSLAQISEKDREESQEIAEALENLPLALDQAGAFIEETQITLLEYRKLLSTSKEKILLWRGATLSDHPESVASTFSLSFQKVEQENSEAADLLRLFAFLSPDAIPEELIKERPHKLSLRFQDVVNDPFTLNEAIRTLLKYSLIRRNSNAQTLTIHRLVQLIIAGTMDEDTKIQWVKLAVYSINQAFPNGMNTEEKREHKKRLFPQVQTCFSLIEQRNLSFPEAAELLRKSVTYLLYQQSSAEALFYSKRLLMIHEQLSGPQHPDIAFALNAIARSYSRLEQNELAESYYQRAIAMRQKILGPENLMTLNSMSNLAFLYYKQGNYQKAEQITKEVLAHREQILGQDKIVTSLSLNNLGLIYTEQGKFEEAEVLYNRALSIRIQISGPKSENAAKTLSNLGRLYAKRGSYKLAEIYIQRAIRIREQLSNTITMSENLLDLANSYKAQGLYNKAKLLYKQVLAIRENSIGLKPSMLTEILESYADLLRKTKREKEAAILEKRAVEIKNDGIV